MGWVDAAARVGAAVLVGWVASAWSAAAAPLPQSRFSALPPVDVQVGPGAGRQALLVADFSGDARADLAAIGPNTVAIFRNAGDGRLGLSEVIHLIDGDATAIALADVTSPPDAGNGRRPDGVPDLLIGDTGGTLTLQHGRADGSFPLTAQVTNLALAVRGIAAGEFDGQAGLDVALIDQAQIYLLCNSAGRLVACGGDPIAPGIGDLIEILAGDFDGDGHTDLAVLSGIEKHVVPLFGGGNARFSVGEPLSVAFEPSSDASVDMAVGRVDADARDDLLIANDDEFGELLGMTLYGSADRQLRQEPFLLEFATTAMVVGDFDAPFGVVDVIGGSADGPLSILFGGFSGSRAFSDPLRIFGPPLRSVALLAVGDLNGDRRLDLVALDAAGTQVTALLNRNGCAGDCNRDDVVTIDELTRGVAIVLGLPTPRPCPGLDRNQRDGVTIDELIVAVGFALEGCGAPPELAAGHMAIAPAR